VTTPWEINKSTAERPLLVAVKKKPNTELIIHLPGIAQWIDLSNGDQWSIGLGGNGSQEWQDTLARLETLLKDVSYALGFLPGDNGIVSPRIDSSRITFFNEKKFVKKTVQEKHFPGEQVLEETGELVLLKCRVPIALKNIGVQQLKQIRLEYICVGQVVDVGFAIKVFTYGKTYVKLELAEVVLLERRTEEIGKATQITQALRTANVEEGSESELSELESDLEMNMA